MIVPFLYASGMGTVYKVKVPNCGGRSSRKLDARVSAMTQNLKEAAANFRSEEHKLHRRMGALSEEQRDIFDEDLKLL
jgi:hypothetical protein